MGPELLAAGVALLSGLFGLITQFLVQRYRGTGPAGKPYSERLSEHMSALIEASRKVDALLQELYKVANTREVAVRKLEADLASLQHREQELRRTIDELQDVPVPVADRLAALLEPGEKRSAWRDYILFGAGVVVSTIVGIILEVAL